MQEILKTHKNPNFEYKSIEIKPNALSFSMIVFVNADRGMIVIS